MTKILLSDNPLYTLRFSDKQFGKYIINHNYIIKHKTDILSTVSHNQFGYWESLF